MQTREAMTEIKPTLETPVQFYDSITGTNHTWAVICGDKQNSWCKTAAKFIEVQTSDTSEGMGKSQAPIISTKYQKLQIG